MKSPASADNIGRPRMRYSPFHGKVELRGPSQKTLEAIESLDAHVAGEEANDIPFIMESVARPPSFVVKPHGEYAVLTTLESIEEFYQWTREDAFEVVHTLPIKQIATDWYVFWEQIPRMKIFDGDNGEKSLGEPFDTHGVAFFPCSRNGIREMPGGGDPRYDHAMPPVPFKTSDPYTERNNVMAHNAYLKAVMLGNIEDIISHFTDDLHWFARDYVGAGPISASHDKPSATALLKTFYNLYKVDGLALINRVTSNWYVFSEQLLQVTVRRDTPNGLAEGTKMQLRVAGVIGIDESGKFTGLMSYGADPEILQGTGNHHD